MSISEIESKIRELRQLQALVDEAESEMETIKDALKALRVVIMEIFQHLQGY